MIWTSRGLKVKTEACYVPETCCLFVCFVCIVWRGVQCIIELPGSSYAPVTNTSVECQQAPTWQEKPLYFWLLLQNQVSFPPLSSGSFQGFGEGKIINNKMLCFYRSVPVNQSWLCCRTIQITWLDIIEFFFFFCEWRIITTQVNEDTDISFQGMAIKSLSFSSRSHFEGILKTD